MDANLDFLKKLWALRQAMDPNSRFIDTSQLAADFLEFSSLVEKPALTVNVPASYSLGESQKRHLDQLLEKKVIGSKPDYVDFSGTWDGIDDNLILFFSPMQKEADHRSYERSFLDPLLEAVYIDGFPIIRDFTLHEVLYGRVLAKRGGLNLSEAPIFPERFTAGPYDLSATLDTPSDSVANVNSLYEILDEFNKNPKASLLTPSKIRKAYEKALSIRSRLGPISRLDRPGSSTFSATTSAVILRTHDADMFYLFAEKEKKNVLVYFGDNPFKDRSPACLEVLDGGLQQKAVPLLLQLGIYDVSSAVLEERIARLEYAYDNAAIVKDRSIRQNYGDFEDLIDGLKKLREYFGTAVNPDVRREYCARLPPELLEFVVHPSSPNPVIHVLLPRLSWSPTMRDYHNPRKFIREFMAHDDASREKMLENVTSSILFANQQNNDVNCWLYQNHREFCESAGIKFEVT